MAGARTDWRFAAALALTGAAALAPVPASAPPAIAQAQPRKVALLIGNGAYATPPGTPNRWPRLTNPDRDVKLVQRSLEKIGFQVTLVTDVTLAQMRRAIARFSQSAKGADIALFYYGGHGFEYQRHNYLVPTDGPGGIEQGSQMSRSFVDLDDAAKAVAQARVTVMMLDACRTSGGPLIMTKDGGSAGARRSALIKDYDLQKQPGKKIGVLYSTARGVPAKDAVPKGAPYSPFAEEVAQNVIIPRVDLLLLLGSISAGVSEKTSSLAPPQQPYTYNSLAPGTFLYTGPALPALSFANLTLQSPAPQEVRRQVGGAAAAELKPLELDPKVLETTDETVLAVQVLKDHPASELAALAARDTPDPMATYLLGYMYEFGIGVPLDLTRARSLLEKAAGLGPPSGELELAYFLLRHHSQPGDLEKSLKLFRESANSGFAKARGHYASVLMGSYPDLKPLIGEPYAAYQQGLAQLRLAARSGYPYAMYSLAERGSDADKTKWKSALERLAAGNDLDGHHWLCELEAEAGNWDGALPHCRIAAPAGFADSQAQMAYAAAKGLGRDASLDDARHWARQALSQTTLEPEQRARLEALDLFPPEPAQAAPQGFASLPETTAQPCGLAWWQWLAGLTVLALVLGVGFAFARRGKPKP